MIKKTIGIIGTGVIGSGWATRFLAHGHKVIAFDPALDAELKLRKFVDRAINYSRQLYAVGHVNVADRYDLEFVDSLEEMAASVDFIQESIPEREDLKRTVLAALSQHAKPEVIIASSSSGLLPTVIQQDCINPERVLIGHPFNPVYLLPLCEVLGGEKTSELYVEKAIEFYHSVGMHPLKVRTEIEGYISDRLQEALWREILHMVNDGVATTKEIDEAIIYGPGLRWAMMGTCLTFHLAGGEQGMRHMLEQFGPALELPWTHLKAPELTDSLIDRMVSGTQEQAKGLSIEQLENKRDDCLVAIMQGLQTNDYGAGKTIATQKQEVAIKYSAGQEIAAPLAIYRGVVSAKWIDYNQHMTDGAYVIAFGDAFDAFARFIGCDEDYREKKQRSFFTAEAHVNYYQEVKLADPFTISTQVIYSDEKKVHLYYAMYHGLTNDLLCTSEQMLLHVDMVKRSVTAIEGDQLMALKAVSDAHAGLEIPKDCQRLIGKK